MEVSFLSDVGRKRKTNQDYVKVFRNQAGYLLALLADGMGGHQAGDIASVKTVEDIGGKWQATEIDTNEVAVKWLDQVIQTENELIYTLGQSNPELDGMGTTVVAITLINDQFSLASVGDSRIYLLRESEFIQMTEDHSLVNELVKSGEITPEMASKHPRKNVLTRSVGMPTPVEIDVTTHFLRRNDFILLCSDGLTNMLSDDEIAMIIEESATTEIAVQMLIEAANERGGRDNITALLLHYGGDEDA